MTDNPLGRQTEYPAAYAPELLFGIDRAGNRSALGLTDALPFAGRDLWRAYELSWLDGNGKPVVAVMDFCVPCNSPRIVESKSLKLYLNSLNQTAFNSVAEVSQTIADDLEKVLGVVVAISIQPLQQPGPGWQTAEVQGTCLDQLQLKTGDYHVNPELLSLAPDGKVVSRELYSNLFRSNCPVTGQPDWATVCISYRGREISEAALLSYLVSYREHSGYHEECAERAFLDIMRVCVPEQLTVSFYFLRRGGIDINPVRSTQQHAVTPESIRQRLLRQ